MPHLDTIGSTAATAQGVKYGWSYREGETEYSGFIGPVAAVLAIYNAYKVTVGGLPQYDKLDFENDGGLATLRCERHAGFSGNASLLEAEALWELLPNEVLKPIETMLYFTTTDDDGAAVTAADLANIRRYYSRAQDPTAAPLIADKALELYKYLLWGMEECYDSSYSLRRTYTVSGRTTLAATYTGVNTVEAPPNISTANTLIGVLPSGEWLKKGPVVRSLPRRKWHVQQEWWWAKQWAKVYGGTWTP